MLDSAELSAVIQNAVCEEVPIAVLLDARGSVVSSACTGTEDGWKESYATTVAATANMWRAYARNDRAVNRVSLEVEPDALEQVLVDFGTRKFCAMAVADTAVLCLVGTIEMGMLKLKTAALQRVLDHLLRPAMAVEE